MPRGMDERFEDPADEVDEAESAANRTTARESEEQNADAGETSTQSNGPEDAPATDGDASDPDREPEDEPLNIREDWDPATIYVEPEQSEDIEIAFTRLKKQLKRENVTLEKNKHFYRAIFEVAFDEHREETKAKIREIAMQDDNQ
ncbi:hypothetical protein [Halobellus sp. LT62]|uniref:hypothetical protein n=1 Tax=Halobellus salinisoli TaxID=3108500 RepID=UPI00300A05CF